MSLPKRLKALQGLWVESREKGRGKTWSIDSYLAAQVVPDGKRGKKYTLTAENGDVVWGKGTYVLDKSFKAGDKVATWYAAAGDKVAFSWKRSEGEGSKASQKEEKRIDPADGKAYTKAEMTKHYAKTMPRIEVMLYWGSCDVTGASKAAGKAKAKAKAKATSEVVAEQRIDPSDGKAYTLAEMRAFYSSTYTKKQTEAFWETCKVAKPKPAAKAKADPDEKRVDPADGKAYTLPELRAFYSSVYTKKQTEAYFADECKPVKGKAKAKSKASAKPEAKTKAKAKAKVKASAKPKAKTKALAKPAAKTKAKPKWTAKSA